MFLPFAYNYFRKYHSCKIIFYKMCNTIFHLYRSVQTTRFRMFGSHYSYIHVCFSDSYVRPLINNIPIWLSRKVTWTIEHAANNKTINTPYNGKQNDRPNPRASHYYNNITQFNGSALLYTDTGTDIIDIR